uniref:Immunoglobulin V-set domain-containing protein n=1 Tax=Seriola lalandi dorsalis TaxID=1841481 RepID=A0A3B4XW09_SERLL
MDTTEILYRNPNVKEMLLVLCASPHRNFYVMNVQAEVLQCYNSSEHSNMYFCKGVCSRENILIQTERKRSAVTRRGRYSMEVDRGDGVFNVTMKKLKRSDAGRYCCGVGKTFSVLYQEINLIVTFFKDSSILSNQYKAWGNKQAWLCLIVTPPPLKHYISYLVSFISTKIQG